MSAHGLATLCRVSEQADWLDDLPADATLRFERLTALLDQISRKKMNASARLACVNAVLPLMTDLVAEKIENQFPMALPLSAAHLQNVHVAETAYTALAHAYARALEPQKKTGAMDLSPQENAVAHYGVMRCLAEILCLAFTTYRKPGAGTWRRIHGVYTSALQQRLHLLELLDVPFADATGTILQEYKRTLLLGLSDPYELPFAALGRLFGLLRNWASLAHLHTEHSDSESFWIDPSIDAPALPLPRNRKPVVGGWLLDTRELIEAIEQEADGLTHNARKQHDPEQKVFKTLQTIKILRRHWSGFATRQYTRQRVTQDYEMLVGLRAVDFGLNGFQAENTEFVESNDNIVITTHGLHGSFGAQQWLSEHRFAEPHQCRSIDQNTEGMQLLVVPDPELALHIGELLALKRTGDWEEWRIGVLRWAKQNDEGRLVIGVYLIGYHAKTCRIQLDDTDRDDPRTENETAAVLVQLSHPPGIGESMVAAPGIYSNQHKLWLRTNADLETRTMGRLLLTTRSFDWFEIHSTSLPD